jgi:pimeloyl-ACP methyl ester carboxylesterase
VEELENFETRYPDASILGVLLRDARTALDAIERCEYVDKDRIFVVGYATGAYTAAHLAAMDDRPAGYALISPPPPFRLDTETNRTGGFRRWSLDTMLHPQMGFFVENVSRVPYDIDELYGLMAPKPLLLVTSELNWQSPPELTGEGVKSATKVYAWEKAVDKITHLTPKAYNHFDSTIQELVVDWLSKVCTLSK